MVSDKVNPSLVFEKAYAGTVKPKTFYCEDDDCILKKLKRVGNKKSNGLEEWK